MRQYAARALRVIGSPSREYLAELTRLFGSGPADSVSIPNVGIGVFCAVDVGRGLQSPKTVILLALTFYPIFWVVGVMGPSVSVDSASRS